MKTITCPCGALVPRRSNRQKWCPACAVEENKRCARRNGRARRAAAGIDGVGCLKECRGCKRDFVVKASNQRYCSVTCREDARKTREARRQVSTRAHDRGVRAEEGDPFAGVTFT